MKIAFITGHDISSKRKVDFHFWAESLARQGNDVKFITVGLSLLTPIKKNHRKFSKPYNQWLPVSTHLEKYIWCPFFHPLNLHNRFLNWLSTPLFSLYPLLLPSSAVNTLRNSDVIIVENGSGLALVPTIAKICPNAKLIYTVSDRLQTLDVHPILYSSEKKAISYFDLIRIPAMAMKSDYPANMPVHYIRPGLNKSLFDKANTNPYTGPKNAIVVGDMLFDGAVIEELAQNFPQWTFHLFGKKTRLNTLLKNVVEYGERDYSELVPYIQHADIGLAPYKAARDADYLSQSSLKIIQYTYCGLAVLMPAFTKSAKDHIFTYSPDIPGSAIEGFLKAALYNRQNIHKTEIHDWDETIDTMIGLALSGKRIVKTSC